MTIKLILLLIVLSWIYWLIAYWLVRIFFRSHRDKNTDFEPPISILKPVKGVDAQAYENFVSFCQQDYPEYEIIFGVANSNDPVIPEIERLQRDFPDKAISLYVTPVSGANEKASLLAQLTQHAKYPILAASDSDMRVTPDYLHRVVAPLADSQVGLVTCLYRAQNPVTLTARLEALYMGVTFLPSVIVARKVLHMRFAMGATVVMRQEDLERIGGFSAFANYLADDYQLGSRIAGLGLRIELSDYIVICNLGETTFRTQWHREVRWAHCNRTSRPLEYPGLLLSFSTPLAFILLFLSGFSGYGWLAFTTSLMVRWTAGWLVTRYTGDTVSRRWLFLLPIRDMLSALVWFAGLLGRVVVWRGERFILKPDGRLILLPARRPRMVRAAGNLFGRSVRQIDANLGKFKSIHEFCDDDQCILRLSEGECQYEVLLSDGTHLAKGESIGYIHFWNEHIPQIPEDGPNLAWALAFQRRCVFSMNKLADFIQRNPHLGELKAFRAEPPFGSQYGYISLDKLIKRWGFDIFPHRESQARWGKFAQFWEHLYAFGLLWTFNPVSMRGKGFEGINRVELWISKNKLLDKYGTHKRLEPIHHVDGLAGWQVDKAEPLGSQSAY